MCASNCHAMSSQGFVSVESVLEDIRRGRMVVVCDDDEREAEGDLTMAAELVSREDVAFMAVHGRGLICLPMDSVMVERLGIPDMVGRNNARLETAFTTSIDAREGVTRGISAADRARTIRVAVDPGSGPGDLAMPGHVFPLRAKPGGVLQRAGPYRGGRGPGVAHRALCGRGHLRGYERGWHHGPCLKSEAVRSAPRAEDGLDRPAY